MTTGASQFATLLLLYFSRCHEKPHRTHRAHRAHRARCGHGAVTACVTKHRTARDARGDRTARGARGARGVCGAVFRDTAKKVRCGPDECERPGLFWRPLILDALMLLSRVPRKYSGLTSQNTWPIQSTGMSSDGHGKVSGYMSISAHVGIEIKNQLFGAIRGQECRCKQKH